MSKKPVGDDYTEEEAQRRFEATLKGALNTPPKARVKESVTKPVSQKKPGGPSAKKDRPET